MTDLIKDHPEASSKKLADNLNSDQLWDNFDIFYKEMALLGATQNTLFILWGNKVQDLFLKEPVFHYNNIICCPHFAYYIITTNQWIKIVRSSPRHHNKITANIFACSPFVGDQIDIAGNLTFPIFFT